MAQPTNTYDSYDQVGIREDLEDMIYDVSPEETPFYSASAKVTAKNTYHEWQTDALRAAADNAHPEGDDTVASARTATVRLGNYTQIFKDAVVIPGSDEGTDKAGRAGEMAYQVMKVAKEQKLDIEKALLANTARASGSGDGIRRLAGVPTWLTTNTDFGSGGADATGDGSNARTDGTQAAWSQTRFNTVAQSVWENGGKLGTVYLSAYQMNIALGFTGNNNQRATIDATKNQVENDIVIYRTPWGSVKFQMSRHIRGRDVLILQDDMWKIGVLRATKNEPLAKTGDSEKRQVVTELTLVCANEKASGGNFDCSTS